VQNQRVANMELAFEARPEAYGAWRQLVTAIKSTMDERRYELVTLAAARRLRSSYCCLAHGAILLEKFGEPVREIALDHRGAGLDEVDCAVMEFAERVVDDATSIGEEDHDRLRALGLSDDEIMDVVLAATARCFFSKTLDALCVQADASYRDELDPEVREALVVGRPIALD
jgi:alkylhydroperoxidase family enzyme